jgi:molybdate transport system regulatory protein
MARLTIRIDFGPGAAIGPGKIRLLEMIGDSGSISAAGRTMGMSYRRAWTLVAALNQSFREPAVETQLGGTHGGGAALTRFGRTLVDHYRAIERAAARAGAGRLTALESARAGRTSPAKTLKRATRMSARAKRSPLLPRRPRRGASPKRARGAKRVRPTQ